MLEGLERVRRAKAYRGLQDGELVALVAERDPGALEALYDRYGTVAYSLARRVLTDARLAEEVVREVFLSLWRDAGRLDPERGTVGTGLLSTTHHRAVDVIRREESLRRGRGPGETLGLHSLGLHSDQQVQGGIAEAPAPLAQVRAALTELPEPQRETILLAYFGGYTQREVASLLDVPLATVKTRMAAGMRRLKETLRDAHQQEQYPWSRR